MAKVYVVFPRAIAVFFFQAEDGIRYRNVTGVQTCALPILADSRSPISARYRASARRCFLRTHGRIRLSGRLRSEERRVGKECSPWLWVDPLTTKRARDAVVLDVALIKKYGCIGEESLQSAY